MTAVLENPDEAERRLALTLGALIAKRKWREMSADQMLHALPPEQFVAGLSWDNVKLIRELLERRYSSEMAARYTCGPEMKDVEDALVEKIMEWAPVEKRLEGLSADERMEGLSAKERMAGMNEEEKTRFLELLAQRTNGPTSG